MSQALEEMCTESNCTSHGRREDFCSRFDLIGGTSSGGMASLISSQNKST